MHSQPVIYRFTSIRVDVNRRTVHRDDQPLDLEPKAFRVLVYLIEHRDRVVPKEELIGAIWLDTFVTDNALTRVIAQIRKQLGDNARAPIYIETAATAGYRFIAELSADRPPARIWPLRQMAATLLAAAALSAVVWWFESAPAPLPFPVRRVEQLTSSASADLWPAFSPDRSQLAFSSNRTGHFELYVRSLAPGGVERQLTSDWQDNIQPSWSPDGQYLAFVAKVRGGIGIVPSSGGPIRYLTDSGLDPHWSPDGSSLVYRSGNLTAVREPASFDTHLMLVGMDGSAPRTLTRPGSPHGGHNFPRWHPDGRHIVFIAPSGESSSAPWIVDARTGELKLLHIAIDNMQFPAFTADGRYLYFVGAGSHEPLGVWRARLDRHWQSQEPEVVMPATGPTLRDLAVDAGGSRIAISQEVGDSAIWSVPVNTAGTATATPRPLIQDHSFRNTNPEFSADGSRLAYSSVRQGGNWTIFVAASDGSSPVPLTPSDRSSALPAWLANHLTLGYQRFKKHDGGYWLSPVDGPPRQVNLKLDLRKADDLRISPDGTRMVAHMVTPKGMSITVEDLATGRVREVTPADRNISFPSWSPDGRWIAAQERIHGDTTLVIIPAAGGEIQTLVSEPGHTWAHGWSPDGDRISFAGLRDGVWNIYWVSRSTKRIQQLTHFTSQSAFVRYPAWSPRNDQVVFERNELEANIYVADLR